MNLIQAFNALYSIASKEDKEQWESESYQDYRDSTEIEKEISILTDTMVAFEEMTDPKDKAIERPKVVIMTFRNAFTRLIHTEKQIKKNVLHDLNVILKDYSVDRPIPPSIIRQYMDSKL